MEIPAELVAAKETAEPALFAIPGVVGVGLGFRQDNGALFEELAVRIHIADGFPVLPGIPAEIGGVAVSIISGTINPCASPDTTRYAELGGGIQITKPTRGFGTLGAIVKDANSDQRFGLTCFHVVGATGAAFPDTIWQATNPPLVMGGSPVNPADNVGAVVREHFPNLPTPELSPRHVGAADAAAFALDRALANGRTVSQHIVSDNGQAPPLVPKITATARFKVSQNVRKRGFKTRLTTGLVIGAHASVRWTPGAANAFLLDQFEIAGSSDNANGKFCEEGDSGSVILDAHAPTAIGLLWGEYLNGRHAFASPIEHVESQLGVRLVF